MTKSAGGAEEMGEMFTGLSSCSQDQSKILSALEDVVGSCWGSLISLSNAESSVCKVGSVCLLRQQNHAELLYAALTTSGLGMRAAESCSAISSPLKGGTAGRY